MPFKHPVDRTSAAAVANTDDKTSAKSEDKKQGKEPPVKLNTVDFIGLKLDAGEVPFTRDSLPSSADCCRNKLNKCACLRAFWTDSPPPYIC